MSTGYVLLFMWLALSTTVSAIGIMAKSRLLISIGAVMVLSMAVVSGVS